MFGHTLETIWRDKLDRFSFLHVSLFLSLCVSRLSLCESHTLMKHWSKWFAATCSHTGCLDRSTKAMGEKSLKAENLRTVRFKLDFQF